MTAHDRACEKRRGAGFVLVGVVMMVLALTILGLSLFSLSSYEAQFMNRSLDGEQALQYAMGGLDRARFALTASPGTLSNVKSDLPYEYVTYARASQLKPGPVMDSMGVVLGSGNDVEIVVQAEYRGVTRRVQGSYQPVSQTNYYKRVFSIAAGGITVNDEVGQPPEEAEDTVVIADSIWQNNSSLAWTAFAAPKPPSSYGVNRRYVPVPAVLAFITAHAAAATPIADGNPVYNLMGTPGAVSYWYTNDATPTSPWDFSSYYDSDATINVDGLAVWMLPNGLRIDGEVTITGTPGVDALVIVARDGTDQAFALDGAIWFFGGVKSNIPVILVSDGWVKIEQFSHPDESTMLPNLSIFANHLWLTGPSETSGSLMTLGYGAGVMDPIIDQLMAAGALPNAVSNAPFALRPGTWRVVQ